MRKNTVKRHIPAALLLMALLAGLCLTLVGCGQALDTTVVYDYAEVLTDSEETALRHTAEQLREVTGENSVLYILTREMDSSAEEEARKLGFTSTYDSCFALVVFIDTDNTYYYETYTLGDMSRYISDEQYDEIDSDSVLRRYIKEEKDPVAAGNRFFTLVGEAAQTLPAGKQHRWVIALIWGAVLGLVAGGATALGVWLSYRRKSRSAAYPLNEYTRLYLSTERDVFLGSSVIKTRVVEHNGGSGGGGSSHSGGGRSGGRH